MLFHPLKLVKSTLTAPTHLWPEIGEENPCLLCGSIMGPENEECAAGGNADDFMFFL